MKQIEHAIRLRDAAVELLRKQGTRDSEGNVVFDKATSSNSYPRSSLLLPGFHPTADSTSAFGRRTRIGTQGPERRMARRSYQTGQLPARRVGVGLTRGRRC
jgi:hypothetical protein